MCKRLKLWVETWIDRRGRIPFWAYWIWPKAHWCPAMDDLLILDDMDNCFCEKRWLFTCEVCGKRPVDHCTDSEKWVCVECAELEREARLRAFRDP